MEEKKTFRQKITELLSASPENETKETVELNETKEVVKFSQEQKEELKEMFQEMFLEFSTAIKDAKVLDLTEENTEEASEEATEEATEEAKEEVVEETKEELSAVEEVKPIKPAAQTEVKQSVKFAQNRPKNSIQDRVFDAINN